MARANPLTWNVPISNPDGTPTEEFQRAWQQQLAVNKDIPALDTAAEVSAVLDKLGVTPGSLLHRGTTGWGLVTGANGDFVRRTGGLWQTLSTASAVQALLDQISNVRGTVLYRGSGGWSGLGPGTAGNVLSTNGAGADPSWIAAGGGGGGGDIIALPYIATAVPAANSIGAASKGNTFYTATACTLKKVIVPISAISAGSTYRCDIFPTNANATTLTGAAIATATLTGVAANSVMTFDFTATPVALAAATPYAVMITGTAAGSTTAVNNIYSGASGVWPLYGNLIGGGTAILAAAGATAACARVTLASLNPVSGNAISSAGGSIFAITLIGTNP